MRADAQRNRELIVTTALDLFTERGAGVSMDEIARAAGLGVGTLYRHFPDRQALLDDLAVDALRRLLAFGRAAAAEDTSRWQVLRQIIDQCCGLPLALIKSLSDGASINPDRRRLQRALDLLFERIVRDAQEEGTLRRDLPPREVVVVLNVMVCRPGARADDHLSTVILDGLRVPERRRNCG